MRTFDIEETYSIFQIWPDYVIDKYVKEITDFNTMDAQISVNDFVNAAKVVTLYFTQGGDDDPLYSYSLELIRLTPKTVWKGIATIGGYISFFGVLLVLMRWFHKYNLKKRLQEDLNNNDRVE